MTLKPVFFNAEKRFIIKLQIIRSDINNDRLENLKAPGLGRRFDSRYRQIFDYSESKCFLKIFNFSNTNQ